MPHTRIAPATPFDGTPKINCASVYGAAPGKPVVFRIPVSGARPITYAVDNLPAGLSLKGGIISGSISEEGSYAVTLRATNAIGCAEKSLVFEVHPNTVLLTPLMGYTSWNDIGFQVSQTHMEQTADTLLSLGLGEYGYRYINTDSGWQGEYGGELDAVQPNEKFPDIQGMCNRFHEQGLLCGIYSTPMLHAFGCGMNHIPLPPGCTQGEPDDRFADERGGIGVIRKEQNNALQWAQWGFDYLKYDWRPSDPYNAELMRQELVKTDRSFGFCCTVKARPEYHKYWKKYCNSYRCSADSIGVWSRTMELYRAFFDFIPYINRGHFYDLDMLDIGPCDLFRKLHYTERPDFGYSEDETILVYSLRAFLASPIQISCDLSQVDDFLLSVLCNEEVIAINQDCGFDGPKPYLIQEKDDSILHIWKRKLENGDIAYGIFNLGDTAQTATVYFDSPGTVRDIWAKKDLEYADTFRCTLQPHCVRLIRLRHSESSTGE